MSYSISATGATKAEAKANIEKAFDASVLASQPIHKRDKFTALNAANDMIDLLTDVAPPNQVIHVSLSGSLGWQNTLTPENDNPLITANVNASAHYYVAK